MRIFNMFDTYKGLPRGVYVIFFAQIINRFGDFVRPFLTLFLTSQFGYSVSATGILIMITTLVTIPAGFIAGKLSDQFGRKKTFIIAQTASAIALLMCTFVYKNPVMIILIIIASFFGGAVRPIIGAMLADILTPEERQRGFSLSYLGINIGVALGPIVAGFLFNHMLFMIFLGDAITSFIAVALVTYMISESLPDKDAVAHSEAEAHAEGNVFSVLWQRKNLLLFLIFNTFFSATYVQTGFALPLILDKIYGENGAPIFGSLMSLNAIVVIFMTLLITKFSERHKPIVNIGLGGITYIIGFGMIGFIRVLPLFWLSTFIWTLGEIINAINFGVYVTNQTPQNFRARFNAVMNLSFSIGAIIGTALIGKIIDVRGIFEIWNIVAVMALIGTLGMFGIYIYQYKTHRHS